jgi:hypothetical protein
MDKCKCQHNFGVTSIEGRDFCDYCNLEVSKDRKFEEVKVKTTKKNKEVNK